MIILKEFNKDFYNKGRMAIWKYITAGQSNDQYYVVKDGLQVGDTLIVGGNYNLAHQSKVEISSMERY